MPQRPARKKGLFFRNKTHETVFIAIRTYERAGWTVDGWYKVGPNQVVKVRKSLGNRYCYYYAASRARKWTGQFPNWVRPSETFSYTIRRNNGQEELADNLRGFVSYSFRHLDVGQAKSYTLSIAP